MPTKERKDEMQSDINDDIKTLSDLRNLLLGNLVLSLERDVKDSIGILLSLLI
jgi:hypothetical protein